MLIDCYKYAAAINAKGEPFPTEPLIMALLLSSNRLLFLLQMLLLLIEAIHSTHCHLIPLSDAYEIHMWICVEHTLHMPL